MCDSLQYFIISFIIFELEYQLSLDIYTNCYSVSDEMKLSNLSIEKGTIKILSTNTYRVRNIDKLKKTETKVAHK